MHAWSPGVWGPSGWIGGTLALPDSVTLARDSIAQIREERQD